MTKILIIDIETSPNLAYVWRFFKENISAKQVIENSYLMSVAMKWLGEDEVMYFENRSNDDKLLIEKIIYYLDQADVCVAHNGKRFDLPKIRGRALVHGLKPPSPVKIIDTCLIARSQFGFPSNSLEYLSNILDLNTKKGGHKKFPGFDLWTQCLKQNDEAWEQMREYNILDIISLEEMYLKMRPWMTTHPNVAISTSNNLESPSCPKCASGDVQWRGKTYTSTSAFHKFQCNSCGGWGRSRYTLLPKNENVLANLAS